MCKVLTAVLLKILIFGTRMKKQNDGVENFQSYINNKRK